MLNEAYVPEVDQTYVPNGNYDGVYEILSDPSFLNILLTGPTGAGKTKMIEQIHALIKKPLIRVNITIESDEDSLMGGFRLQDGATYFSKGPVIQAMEMGATLLLDEMDLGNPMKVMCLQSVLEGVGYLIKKTGEFVKPKEGFKIVATANTKGGGDEDGIYIGTQTLNGAMLDRFPLVFECDYPVKSIEVQILNKNIEALNFSMADADVALLVDWASSTRTKGLSFNMEYTISTRRLVDIVKVNKIVKDMDRAIQMCLNRFDERHKQAFFDSYLSIKPSKGKNPDSQDPFIAQKTFKL